MKITLFIMTYKGLKCLQRIVNVFGADIIDKVITSEDSNVQNDYFDEIVELCTANHIRCFENRDEVIDTDYAIAVSWKWIIKTDKTLIVLHDSLLPKYKGFAPLVTALINKEDEIGVTAIIANEDYDCGDIIDQTRVKVTYPVKIREAIDVVSIIYQNLIQNVISNILKNAIVRKPQTEDGTYSIWLDDDDYIIDWSQSAEDICHFINCVGYPYRGASTTMNGKKVRILDSEISGDKRIENRQKHLGKVIFLKEGLPTVVCGLYLLKIKQLVNEKEESILLKKLKVRFK